MAAICCRQLITFAFGRNSTYYLTENLLGESSKSGILIAAFPVTIDLNGFALDGQNIGIDGITKLFSATSDVTIRNGNIHSWISDGIELAAAALFPHLTLTGGVDEGFPGERIGSTNELLRALRSGRVTAQGREDGKGRLQEISAAEWVALDFRRGNDVFRDDGSWWAGPSVFEAREQFTPRSGSRFDPIASGTIRPAQSSMLPCPAPKSCQTGSE